MTSAERVDPSAPPSGTGCLECDESGSWWIHLRRCASCGHIGCCDVSLNRHARAHFHETGHPVIQSFEPGENWAWDWTLDAAVESPRLAPPTSHPATQTVPGPAERVPGNWQDILENAAESR
jgi:hypothetical protein